MMLMLAGCSVGAVDATPTPPPDRTPSLSVSPSTGAPGTPVAVTGAGWSANTTVLIYVHNPSAAPSTPADQVAVQVVTASVGADGRFVAAFVLPTHSP